MRCTQFIGRQSDSIEPKSIKPKDYPWPQCGQKGKRQHGMVRRMPHGAALHRRSWMVAEVGVSTARCGCGKYFQAAIPGVPYKGRSSSEVRNRVAPALIRDRLPDRLVIARMQADHVLALSLGYIHRCFLWAHEPITMEEPWDCVRANFAGVLCVDDVHDRGRTLLFATAPRNNFTVSFALVEPNDQPHMETFLQALTDRGLDVEVALTDGSPLYQDSLHSYGQDVAQQRCLFHVIQEVHQRILDGVRAIKNRLKRQGNKGRKKRPGRPSKHVESQRQRRPGLSKKEQATFLWEHQYLLVRTHAELSAQDKAALALMGTIAPELTLLRHCNRQFYGLCETGITKPWARARRLRLVNKAAYQAHTFLAKALKKLNKDKFEPMIVCFGWDNVDRTNHHVERNTRVFRMLPKTRDKRRKDHTIAKALELDLYARMLRHPLYEHNFRERHIPFQEAPLQKMAASCIWEMNSVKNFRGVEQQWKKDDDDKLFCD